MPILHINTGTPNDGTGDDLRTAFEKVNSNFGFLNINGAISYADNVGPTSGAAVFKDKDANTLNFRKLNSDDESVTITQETNYVNIEVAFSSLIKDLSPQLGGNLDLNGWNIINTGNSVSNISVDGITVSGVKVGDIVDTISAIVYSNSVDLDFGRLPHVDELNYEPIPYDISFGGLLADPSGFELNFGTLENAAASSSTSGADIDGGFA